MVKHGELANGKLRMPNSSISANPTAKSNSPDRTPAINRPLAASVTCTITLGYCSMYAAMVGAKNDLVKVGTIPTAISPYIFPT